MPSVWMKCILWIGLALSGPLAAQTPAEFRISLLKTGQSAGAAEALVVKGGRWLTERHLIHAALLVEHPQGRFLFDTGLGRSTPEAFADNRWVHRKLFDYEQLNPAIDQLLEAGYSAEDIDFILPSHLHWDHTGGLPDFPDTPVWVPEEALAEAQQGHRPSFLAGHLDSTTHWKALKLNDTPYQGFSRSLDLFGDGRLVLVDLSGHTRGQVGMFAHLDSGRTLFFIGDTSWTMVGVEEGQPRPKIVQWLAPVDADFDKNLEVLKHIETLKHDHPDWDVIPAHDEVVANTIARFPEFEE